MIRPLQPGSARHARGLSLIEVMVSVLVLGIGLGPGQSMFNLAVQNAVPRERLGVATSSIQFFRQIGSTIGVALFGTALTNRMSSGLEKVAPGVRLDQLQAMGGEHAADMGLTLPPAVQEIVADSVTHGLTLALVVVAASFTFALMMPQRELRHHGE